jgi:hypothetical protein
MAWFYGGDSGVGQEALIITLIGYQNTPIQ